jgi:hypothetical protein
MDAYGNKLYPKKGDYLQLLDANNRPCENHATIDVTTGALGVGLFLIRDNQGEAFACVRLPDDDTDTRHAWQQVITSVGV